MADVTGKIFDIKLFKKLSYFIIPYKVTYNFVMFSAISLSLSSTLTPYFLKVIVDDYIRPKDYSGMVFFVILMLVTLFLEVVFQFLLREMVNLQRLFSIACKSLSVKVQILFFPSFPTDNLSQLVL